MPRIENARNARRIFGIICAVKSIRALIGSRETWKISYVRVGKEEDAPFSGRVPFRVSYRAFPGPLLKRGRGLRPLSFPAKQNKGKRKKGRERWERQAQEVRVVRPTHLPFMAVSFWAKWERRGLCHTHTMNMLMRRMKIGIALLQQVGGFADITVPSRIIAIG